MHYALFISLEFFLILNHCYHCNPINALSAYRDNSAGSGTSDDSDVGSDASNESPKKEKKPAKEKKEREDKPKKEAKTDSEKPRKRRQKKEKDSDKPKRPQTAFMLWLNSNREKIKEDNPGISFTDVAKKGGELWKEMKDKSVSMILIFELRYIILCLIVN